MRIKQALLINQLLDLTQEALLAINQLKSLSPTQLNYKPTASSWSILECIEHLNLYGNFYLPEIERCILETKPMKVSDDFRSSLIGDYFVKQVKVDNPKKLKATKAMDSTGSNLNARTIDQFIKQLEKLAYLMHESKKVDLNKVKTKISLTKLFRLRLGDTFRFLVYHNERHIIQAQGLVKQLA